MRCLLPAAVLGALLVGCTPPASSGDGDTGEDPTGAATPQTRHIAIAVAPAGPYYVGQVVHLRAIDSAPSASTRYRWSEGKNEIVEGPTGTLTLERSGNYDLTLEAEHGDARLRAQQVSIEVLEDGDFELELVTAPDGGVAPVRLVAEANVVGGDAPFEFAWDFNEDGQTDAVGARAERVLGNAGEYTVAVTATDASGTTRTQSTRVEVRENRSFSGTLAAVPADGLAPLTVEFECRIEGGVPPFQFRWAFGDGTDSSEPHPTHTYAEAGEYLPRCYATDAQGQEQLVGSTSINARLDTSPEFELGVAPTRGPIPFTARASALVHSDVNHPLVYEWTLDGVDVGSAQSVQAQITSEGAHELKLRLTDANGDAVAHAIEVFGDPPTGAPVIAFVDTPSCGLATPVTLNASGTWDPDDDPLTFSWALTGIPAGSVVRDFTSVTGDQATLSPDVPGTYTYRLDVSDGEQSVSVTRGYTAYSGPYRVRILEGSSQLAAPGQVAPLPIIAEVQSQCGDPLPGEEVVLVHRNTGGPVTLTTDAAGQITLDTVTAPRQELQTGRVSLLSPGAPVSFSATVGLDSGEALDPHYIHATVVPPVTAGSFASVDFRVTDQWFNTVTHDVSFTAEVVDDDGSATFDDGSTIRAVDATAGRALLLVTDSEPDTVYVEIRDFDDPALEARATVRWRFDDMDDPSNWGMSGEPAGLWTFGDAAVDGTVMATGVETLPPSAGDLSVGLASTTVDASSPYTLYQHRLVIDQRLQNTREHRLPLCAPDTIAFHLNGTEATRFAFGTPLPRLAQCLDDSSAGALGAWSALEDVDPWIVELQDPAVDSTLNLDLAFTQQPQATSSPSFGWTVRSTAIESIGTFPHVKFE